MRFTLGMLALLSLSLMACTHGAPQDNGYSKLVAEYSDRKELYQGFANVLQIQGTFLNSKILNAQVDRKAFSFKWESSEIQKETQKIDESLRTETVLFISFFSPTPRLDDLDKIQTVWRIFLDVNNKRYEGTAIKQSGIYDEMIEYYPYHSRFSTPYKIVFRVPAINIEDYPSRMTITGAMGSMSLEFPPMKK